MTTILAICGVWALGCVALAYVILRAGAACDDGPRPMPRSTDLERRDVSEHDKVGPPAGVEPPKVTLPEEDACRSV